MCLIIVKKAHQKLSTDFVNSVQRRNSDGWGIMWYNRKGQPSVVKGLDLSSFNNWHEKLKHKEFVAHFRMRTDGKINLANAHPYEVVPGVHMMHNGVLHNFKTGANADISDSANFVLKEVRPLLLEKGIEYVNTPEFTKKMEKFTSQSNKLAFITPGGFIVIEPQYWQRTLSGLLVSNSYAYDVDNSNYFSGYSTPKRNHSFAAGAGNFGRTAAPARAQIPSANTNVAHSNLPALTKEVRNEPEANFSALEDAAGGGYGGNGYTGYSPNYSHNRHDYSSTPKQAALVVDNTKRKASSLLDQHGEPVITARGKSSHSMTDAELRAEEVEINGEDALQNYLDEGGWCC